MKVNRVSFESASGARVTYETRPDREVTQRDAGRLIGLMLEMVKNFEEDYYNE